MLSSLSSCRFCNLNSVQQGTKKIESLSDSSAHCVRKQLDVKRGSIQVKLTLPAEVATVNMLFKHIVKCVSKLLQVQVAGHIIISRHRSCSSWEQLTYHSNRVVVWVSVDGLTLGHPHFPPPGCWAVCWEQTAGQLLDELRWCFFLCVYLKPLMYCICTAN